MSVLSELLAAVQEVSQRMVIPALGGAWMPEARENPSKHGEFGLIHLEDGSAGFFYARLGQTADTWLHEQPRLERQTAIDVASRVLGPAQSDVALGLATVNAMGQHLLSVSGLPLGAPSSLTSELELESGDQLGMVGYFPPLVKRFRELGVNLTVIEKKPELVSRDRLVNVTLDLSQLISCSKVICTGATLLNDTLDEVLDACTRARRIVLLGPTAGCLPDPLFDRGIDVIGSTRVRDLRALLGHLVANEPWGDSVAKYSLRRDEYPGMKSLLEMSAPVEKP